MDEAIKREIESLGRRAHDLTESAYRSDTAIRGDDGWSQKQRILLADMSLHLLQTAMRDGEISSPALRQNLYAILTVADQFLPDQDLKTFADAIQEN